MNEAANAPAIAKTPKTLVTFLRLMSPPVIRPLTPRRSQFSPELPWRLFPKMRIYTQFIGRRSSKRIYLVGVNNANHAATFLLEMIRSDRLLWLALVALEENMPSRFPQSARPFLDTQGHS